MNKKSKNLTNEYKWDKKQDMYVPKASPLAYTLYINERKEQIHKEQKNMENGKLSVKQIAKKVKSEWKNMEADDKKKYLSMVEKEKKRFEMQRKEMEDKGYFLLSDGSKSTDIPPPEGQVAKKRSMTPVKVESKRPVSKKK